MTIIFSVKINDGIVMAADSALTFPVGQIYQHANKIVNLRKGLPIGVMSTGNGGIGTESIETLFKDLRRRFTGGDPAYEAWKLDPDTYTMKDVATPVREFLFDERRGCTPRSSSPTSSLRSGVETTRLRSRGSDERETEWSYIWGRAPGLHRRRCVQRRGQDRDSNRPSR